MFCKGKNRTVIVYRNWDVDCRLRYYFLDELRPTCQDIRRENPAIATQILQALHGNLTFKEVIGCSQVGCNWVKSSSRFGHFSH